MAEQKTTTMDVKPKADYTGSVFNIFAHLAQLKICKCKVVNDEPL